MSPCCMIDNCSGLSSKNGGKYVLSKRKTNLQTYSTQYTCNNRELKEKVFLSDANNWQ